MKIIILSIALFALATSADGSQNHVYKGYPIYISFHDNIMSNYPSACLPVYFTNEAAVLKNNALLKAALCKVFEGDDKNFAHIVSSQRLINHSFSAFLVAVSATVNEIHLLKTSKNIAQNEKLNDFRQKIAAIIQENLLCDLNKKTVNFNYYSQLQQKNSYVNPKNSSFFEHNIFEK